VVRKGASMVLSVWFFGNDGSNGSVGGDERSGGFLGDE